MKAESNVKPVLPFEILPFDNDNVEVLFYENIKTMHPENEDETIKYSYDYYRAIVRKRENLEAAIGMNLDGWLGILRGEEKIKSINIPTEKDRLAVLEDTINFILKL